MWEILLLPSLCNIIMYLSNTCQQGLNMYLLLHVILESTFYSIFINSIINAMRRSMYLMQLVETSKWGTILKFSCNQAIAN